MCPIACNSEEQQKSNYFMGGNIISTLYTVHTIARKKEGKCMKKRKDGGRTGVNKYGKGVYKEGTGVNKYGKGVYKEGTGVNKYGKGVYKEGTGVNKYGKGVNKYGKGVYKKGTGVNKYGKGVYKEGE